VPAAFTSLAHGGARGAQLIMGIADVDDNSGVTRDGFTSDTR